MNNYIRFISVFIIYGLLGISKLQAEEDLKVGSEWCQNISTAYEQGHFADFIAKLEMRYAEGQENREWEKEKIDLFTPQQNSEEQLKILNEYGNKQKALVNKYNRLLAGVAKRYPDCFVSAIIHDLPTTDLVVTEFRLWDKFHDLHFKMAIFCQLVGLGEVRAEREKEKSCSTHMLKYMYVIRLYGFDQMLQQQQNRALKQEILEEKAEFASRIALAYNLEYLKSRGQSKNRAEELVAILLKNMEQEQRDLAKELSCKIEEESIK